MFYWHFTGLFPQLLPPPPVIGGTVVAQMPLFIGTIEPDSVDLYATLTHPAPNPVIFYAAISNVLVLRVRAG